MIRRWGPEGRSAVLVTLLGLLAAGGMARAAVPDEGPVVVDVVVTGELQPFDRLEIEQLLRTRPNRRFFGIPGATPSLWLYELGTERTALGRALRRAGEPPAFFDPDIVEGDRLRLQTLYRQAGFLEATVESRVEEVREGRLRVSFIITPGPPSAVRRVAFEGIEHLAEAERRRLLRRSELRLRERTDGGPPSTRAAAPGQRLAEAELLAERRRLLDELRELGFARITRDSIRAVAQPVDTLSGGVPVFDITFQIQTGPRFVFGDVHFHVVGPEDAPARTDTIAVGTGYAITSIASDRRLSPRLLRRALRFEPGELYRQSRLSDTKRRLDATGVFTFSEVAPLAGPAAWARTDTLPRMPHLVTLRPRPRHAIRLDGFVLQRSGVLGLEGPGPGGEELGVGAGASYRNVNAFGGGEQFSVGFNASVAGDLVEFPTAQAEVNVGLRMPYLLWPFSGVERALQPYDTRTRVSMGFLAARRDELRLLIRGRASAGVRLEVQHTPSLASLLDLLDFQLSDPDTLGGFRERFLDLIQDPVARQFVLEDYTNPQINNALRYSLRSSTADPFRRDRGHVLEVALEVGGNLPHLLDRFVFSPGIVEGSIPGPPLFGGGSRLEYRPYVRVVVDGRRYLALNPLTVLALKGIAGFAQPTAHAPVVPFHRRFYIGGVGSVRGWELRQLGPGRVPPEASAFVQGGDIKLEAAAELRRIVIRELLQADWQLALFADAGNIWFGPRNPGDPDGRFRFGTFYEEIAVGGGTGLRVMWDYLILRFDLGWKVRSPVPGQPLFPGGSRPRLHFGIGHAF